MSSQAQSEHEHYYPEYDEEMRCHCGRIPTRHEVLVMGQVEILNQMAAWSEQPDLPTGMHGVLFANDLRLRAIALKIVQEVEDGYEPRSNGLTTPE